MRRGLAVGLVALAGACTFGGLGDYEIGECNPAADKASDPCDTLNNGDEKTCTPYRCNPDTRRCAKLPRDDDRDGVPSGACGGTDCDDKDKDTKQCACNDGATKDCYTGPAATSNVGTCKPGLQTCTNGVWGTCAGDVPPYLGPPDPSHPCDGTNWWCDPSGVVPKFCPDCTTKSSPLPCGSATTCNPTAAKMCTDLGTWGTCLPAPVTTCVPTVVSSCTTCASTADFASGSHKCNSQCTFTGASCDVVGGGFTKQAIDPAWSHACGIGVTTVGDPQYGKWIAAKNTNTPWGLLNDPSGCTVLSGPGSGITLPRGKYQVTAPWVGGQGNYSEFKVKRGGVIVQVGYSSAGSGSIVLLFDETTYCGASWTFEWTFQAYTGQTYASLYVGPLTLAFLAPLP